MHGAWLTGWVVSISWQWCQRPCCHHSHRPHPVPSIRPQSPYSFLSVLEDNHTSGLCHFTEIMRFLNVKANLYHLEGPKYIPKPDKKLFLGHTLGLSIALSYLGAVSQSLWGMSGSWFPSLPQIPGRLSIHTSSHTPPRTLCLGQGVDTELVEGGQGRREEGWHWRKGI